MANERLRTALLQRGVTPADLAEAIGVDPKTIERWIGGRIPYRRHRHQVAVQLGVDETYLWPGALAADQVASASESEILVVLSAPLGGPAGHLGAAVRHGRTARSGSWSTAACSSPTTPACSPCSAQRPSQGVRIRILLGDPDSPEVAQRGEHEGIDDALASKIRNAMVLYRPCATWTGWRSGGTPQCFTTRSTGPTASCWSTRTSTANPPREAPVMHLRQIAGGTLVATYLDSFERVWSESRPLD